MKQKLENVRKVKSWGLGKRPTPQWTTAMPSNISGCHKWDILLVCSG